MATRGVWQLQRLTLNYCEFSGSSRGVREFIKDVLPAFAQKNSQLPVTTLVRHGQHPFWHAEYANGNRRDVGLRNEPAEEVLRQAILLRSSAGRKATVRVLNDRRHKTNMPSVQGAWQPSL